MEEKEYRVKDVINLTLDRMKQEGLYFATKDDTGYASGKDLYKLDESGYVTEKTIDRIVEEVIEYMGDGAAFLVDAVNQWIEDGITEGKIGYIDNLNMEFDDNAVVEGNLEIYNGIGKEDLGTDTEPKEEEISKEAEEVKPEKKTEGKLEESISKSSVKEALTKKIISYMKSEGFEEDEAEDYFIVEVRESETGDLVAEVRAELDFEGSMKLAEILDPVARKYDKEAYFDAVTSGIIQAVIEPKGKIEENFNKALEVKSNKKSLTEGARERLDERNEQSAGVIEQALNGITDQTSEQEAGIITKTSELFQSLSDRGYDVQVSFDNGESTSSISIGQQGANVLITITDAEQPLRAFASGNFEINDDSLKMIKSIMEVLK